MLAAMNHLFRIVARISENMRQGALLASEPLLNDWDTFWVVLDHPELPLTSNEAERALRHWVIARRIGMGTRTD